LRSPLLLAALAASAALGLHLWQGRDGFSLADEGFLWYGVQRVLAGEIPVRDFMSYDPGRYYVSAALMAPWGDDGIMALRGSLVVVQAIGLFAALWLATRGVRGMPWIWGLLALVSSVAWMFPRHRMYDITVYIGLLGAMSFLLTRPSVRRWLLLGLAVGGAAVFGQNHGAYGAFASLVALGYLRLTGPRDPRPRQTLLAWAVGVLVGYSPILLLSAMAPGFAAKYWESIRFLFEIRATNLPLPVPWPWTVATAGTTPDRILHGFTAGIFFFAVAVFAVVGIPWVLRSVHRGQPWSAVPTASAFLALPYAHFTFSRADSDHLAQGVFPFLIGGLAILSSRPGRLRLGAGLLMCGASALVMVPKHPGYQCRAVRECVEARIGDDLLRVDSKTAEHVAFLQRLAADWAPHEEAFVALPHWPGAYALLGRRSPLWSIYALFPRAPEFQRAEIERIRATAPRFVVLADTPLDGREELRFSHTHALIHEYLLQEFTRLDGYSSHPDHVVLIAPGVQP
jgi:hypothetical protein